MMRIITTYRNSVSKTRCSELDEKIERPRSFHSCLRGRSKGGKQNGGGADIGGQSRAKVRIGENATEGCSLGGQSSRGNGQIVVANQKGKVKPSHSTAKGGPSGMKLPCAKWGEQLEKKIRPCRGSFCRNRIVGIGGSQTQMLAS